MRTVDIETHKTGGFTLLEMMLTVGLIALTAVFVTINIGSSDGRLVPLEAKRFVALVNLAQDESILTGQAIKLTVNASEHSYHFVAIDAEFGLLSGTKDPDDLGSEAADKKAIGDEFLKIRKIPEAIQIQFSREPRSKKKTTASKFVAKRVHEILNESILDKASNRFDDDNDESGILIEPNGLITPFTLSLSAEKKNAKIELDRFGKASIVDDKS